MSTRRVTEVGRSAEFSSSLAVDLLSFWMCRTNAMDSSSCNCVKDLVSDDLGAKRRTARNHVDREVGMSLHAVRSRSYFFATVILNSFMASAPLAGWPVTLIVKSPSAASAATLTATFVSLSPCITESPDYSPSSTAPSPLSDQRVNTSSVNPFQKGKPIRARTERG